MLQKLFVAVVVGVLLIPAISQAQFKPGDVEMTLSGSGTNNNDFDTGSFAVGGSLGYFLTKEMEIGGRQSLGWSSGDTNSSWFGVSRLFFDYNFDLDRLVPFVGVNAGYLYGDDAEDAWLGGPEAGLKYFLNSTTFVFGEISYDFNLEEAFDEGAFFYSVGLGVKL